MAWLNDSSIGRKVVMSVTGAAFVLFLLFHGSMNLVAVFSEEGYNMICEFLGANWYALVATLILAALMCIHIIYASILTVQNYKARGNDRYAVTKKPKEVEWASQNMFVLGTIVLLGIALHLFNFWSKMQWVELQHNLGVEIDASNAANGYYWIQQTFGNLWYSAIYAVWLAAIWFHLTHGVWSMLHTMGWNNDTWMPRVQMISTIVASIGVGLFAVVLVYFTFLV